MRIRVLPPNEELVLTRYLRRELTGSAWGQVLVSNRLTARADGTEVPPAADCAVIVRGDGGPALEPPLYLRRVGIRVFGPDGDDNHLRTSELARHVAAAIHDAFLRCDPIADVRQVSGPMRVPPTVAGRPEMYLTAELVLVGDPIT